MTFNNQRSAALRMGATTTRPATSAAAGRMAWRCRRKRRSRARTVRVAVMGRMRESEGGDGRDARGTRRALEGLAPSAPCALRGFGALRTAGHLLVVLLCGFGSPGERAQRPFQAPLARSARRAPAEKAYIVSFGAPRRWAPIRESRPGGGSRDIGSRPSRQIPAGADARVEKPMARPRCNLLRRLRACGEFEII